MVSRELFEKIYIKIIEQIEEIPMTEAINILKAITKTLEFEIERRNNNGKKTTSKKESR